MGRAGAKKCWGSVAGARLCGCQDGLSMIGILRISPSCIPANTKSIAVPQWDHSGRSCAPCSSWPFSCGERVASAMTCGGWASSSHCCCLRCRCLCCSCSSSCLPWTSSPVLGAPEVSFRRLCLARSPSAGGLPPMDLFELRDLPRGAHLREIDRAFTDPCQALGPQAVRS